MKNKITYLSDTINLLTWIKSEHKTDRIKDVLVASVPEGTFYIKYFECNAGSIKTNKKWTFRTKFIPSNPKGKKWEAYKKQWFAMVQDNKSEAELYIRKLRNIEPLYTHPLLNNSKCLYIHYLHTVDLVHKKLIAKNIRTAKIIIFQTESNTYVVKNSYGKVLNGKSWKKWKKENIL